MAADWLEGPVTTGNGISAVMKSRWLRVVPLVAALLLLAGCSGAGPADIELAQTSVDLGVVTNGEVREMSTEVFNRGSAPLLIEAVTTSCGCTSAVVEPTIIPAGASGTLSVTYDSGAHGPKVTGPVLRQVFISSNDPDQREAVFELIAEVVSPQ